MFMKPPFMLNRLIETEVHYARRFTNVTPKPYGVIYWNEANKESYASNHAIITDFIGVEGSIKDICSFYRTKDITPVLYPSLKENELTQLMPHLTSHGFEVESLYHEYFHWQKESENPSMHGVYFDRLVQIKDDVREVLLSDGYGEWAMKYLERHLKSPGFHLIGGFVNEELVTMASLNIFEGYSRIDDAFTSTFYRGKGYYTTLLNHLIAYNKEHGDNHLYLYSHYPEAAKVYEKAGFVKLPNLKAWRAVKKA
jgi:GNAT superfamily N-acetyltransferase